MIDGIQHIAPSPALSMPLGFDSPSRSISSDKVGKTNRMVQVSFSVSPGLDFPSCGVPFHKVGEFSGILTESLRSLKLWEVLTDLVRASQTVGHPEILQS